MHHLAFVTIIVLWATSVFGQQGKAPAVGTDKTVIEGTLSQVSKLPAAEGNAYPDCYYTAILDIAQIVSGRSVPKKIILVLPGFFSRKYAPEAKFKVGDQVSMTVVPFASMPDKVKQTQQADEIEDVDLEFYFPVKITAADAFKSVPNPIAFKGNVSKAPEPIVSQEIDFKARTARQEQIRNDLKNINKLLAKHRGNWDKWYDSLNDFRAKYKVQNDAKAQKWIGDSFFSAGFIENGKVDSLKFVKSVIAFKKYLSARNVDLILVRVPQKGEIVDDLFVAAPTDQVTNPYLLRTYKKLLEADVEIITDITPKIKAARLKYPLMFWYQSFREEHPAEGTAMVIAEELAKRLNRYERIKAAPKEVFTLQQGVIPPGSYRWPEGNPRFNPSESVKFSSVFTKNNTALQFKQGTDSPVLVVGSSFISSPSLEQGGNIPSYLAYLTGVVPDVLYRNGSNDAIPRSIAREGDLFLKNRSVCIFPIVPWSVYGELDSPQIIDPMQRDKVLLASYSGRELLSKIKISSDTPKQVFSFSADGSLDIHSRSKDTRNGGKFRLKLPGSISEFPFFIIEVENLNKDVATIKVNYIKQTDSVHRSFSQDNLEETFIFKPGAASVADFEINNIHPDVATTIKNIKIFGLR